MPLGRLPRELEGLRILHLSDLHLGAPSLNGRTARTAAAWARRAAPDLVALTGDLLAARRGEDELRALLRALSAPYGTFAVLGNVDVAHTRDPFSPGAEVGDLAPDAQLLRDTSAIVEVRGRTVQIAGLDPSSRFAPPPALADPHVDLRILLAHFPDSARRVPAGSFDLVLSGHTHGGQICLPYPGGRVRFSNVEPTPFAEGLFDLDGTALVVSRGLGTTFVPFRLACRPEASVLVLRRAERPGGR